MLNIFIIPTDDSNDNHKINDVRFVSQKIYLLVGHLFDSISQVVP